MDQPVAPRLGFIGTGTMGGGMVARLLEAGYAVTICDPNPAATANLAGKGAQVVATAREVADASEIVFACLPSLAICREVAHGENGVIHGAAITTYVEMSTIGIDAVGEISAKLRAQGIAMLDIPISGGGPGARTGTLTAIVSGPGAAFERVRPFLDVLARHIFYVGEKPGLSQMAKLVNNILSAAGKVAAFEAVVMGVKAGIEAKTLIDIINVSTGRNYTTLKKFPESILPRSFDYGGHLSNGIKDTKLFLAEAKRLNVPLWIAPQVLQMYEDAAAHGYLEGDSIAIYRFVEELAGLTADGKLPAEIEEHDA